MVLVCKYYTMFCPENLLGMEIYKNLMFLSLISGISELIMIENTLKNKVFCVLAAGRKLSESCDFQEVKNGRQE